MMLEVRSNVIYLSGRIHANLWYVVEDMLRMILPMYPRGVTVDCSRIQCVDDAGLGTLVEGLQAIETSRLPVSLANLAPRTRDDVEYQTPATLHRHLVPGGGLLRESMMSEPPAWWERLFEHHGAEPPPRA